VEHAPTLYELLLPYESRNVVNGRVASVSIGAASRYLGLLAATMSRWEEAVDHFERALDLNARMGARPFAAQTQLDFARMLLARDEPGDRQRSGELLSECRATAEQLGMTLLAERAASSPLAAPG
jgi:sugar phosphate isomerase/epimerase